MSLPYPGTATYAVEISGWDARENFFVENTQLHWSEEHGKKAYLHRPLREGSVVFVRIIAPTGSRQTLPIAYQARNLSPAVRGETWEFSLVQMHPRSGTNGASEPEPSEVARKP